MIVQGRTQAVRRALSRMITSIEVKGAEVPERKLLEPRLYFHGNLAGLPAFAAERSTELVAGAGFWRLLILLEEPVVEVRRGTGGAVVATANLLAGTAVVGQFDRGLGWDLPT